MRYLYEKTNKNECYYLFDNFKSVKIRLENVKTFIKRKIQTRQIVEFGFLVRVTGLDGARYALPSTATIVFTFGECRFKSLVDYLIKI